MNYLHIGYGHLINTDRIIAILDRSRAGSLPLKRLRENQDLNGRLVDCTHGRATRSMIVIDSGLVFLSALVPETLLKRLLG